MQIFIMRHGEAAPQNFALGEEDAQRPLTDKGCLEAEATGLWLANTDVLALEMFVSPYLRAQQTCQHVVNALTAQKPQVSTHIKTVDFITPDGDALQVHDFIDGLLADNYAPNTAIMFVSHMPFVSYLVAQLTKSQNMPIFATGSITKLDYNESHMQASLLETYVPSV